jgi:membrane protein involved in colicin uptake
VKYVIEEIARLDTQAFENEQKNKSALFQQKQAYENEMKKYRENKTEAANADAKASYDRIIDKAQSEYSDKEAEIKQKAEQLEKQYLKVEKEVMDSVFNKLFSE